MPYTSLGFVYGDEDSVPDMSALDQALATSIDSYLSGLHLFQTTLFTLTSTATRSIGTASPSPITSGFTGQINVGDLTFSAGTIVVGSTGGYSMPYSVTWSTTGTGQVSVYPILSGSPQLGDTRTLNASHSTTMAGVFTFASMLPSSTTVGIGLLSQDMNANAVVSNWGLQRIA